MSDKKDICAFACVLFSLSACSFVAAGTILGVCQSQAKRLSVDLAWLIEAQAADELPEHLIGCGRIVDIENLLVIKTSEE